MKPIDINELENHAKNYELIKKEKEDLRLKGKKL